MNLQKRKAFRDFKLNLPLICLALPGVIIIFTFCYLPMPGIILAFKNFVYSKGILGSPFVGLDNFKYLFMTDIAWRTTRNTIVMNLLFLLTGNAFSVAIALMLFEIRKKTAIKTYQTIIIFPHFLSWVVVGYMFYALISPQYGLINEVIKSLGKEAVDWYSRPQAWPLIFIFTSIWKGGGMGSVIYYACLVGIDKGYYEAAIIDGATKWQMTKHISLPFLSSMITLFLILGIGGIIRADFGMFYYLTRDIPLLYSTTDVVDTYVYRALKSSGDTGMAAAAGLYQSVVGFVLILLSNYITRKIEPDNSLF